MALSLPAQQAALDISDYADAAEVPIVRFVDVEDALSPAFERPALIVLPPQPLCRLGPPVLDQSSPLPTCEEDTPVFYLDVSPTARACCAVPAHDELSGLPVPATLPLPGQVRCSCSAAPPHNALLMIGSGAAFSL